MDSITDICYDFSPNKEGRIREEYIEPLEKEIEQLKAENARLNKMLNEAFREANNIIYFDDNSDYLPALYTICRLIKPQDDNFGNEGYGEEYIEEES